MSDIFSNIGAAVDTATGISGFVNDIYNAFTRNSRQRHQEGREDTAIRRRVADLRAAGLSPTLAAGSGAESSAPVPSERVGSTDVSSKLIQRRLLESELEARQAQIAQTRAGTEAAKAQTDMTRTQTGLLQPAYNRESSRIGRDFNLREKGQTLAEKTQRDAAQLGVDRLNLDRAVANANIFESQDRAMSRAMERNIQAWNLRFADKHDLPTGHVNSGLAGQLVQAFDLLAAYFSRDDSIDFLELPRDILSVFQRLGLKASDVLPSNPAQRERTTYTKPDPGIDPDERRKYQ